MGDFKDLVGNIVKEQLHGPGKATGKGGMGAAAGAQMRPGTEPSSQEDEFEKDIADEGKPEELAPSSPLGMLIVKAFEQPVDDGTDDADDDGPERQKEKQDKEDSGFNLPSPPNESLSLRNTLLSIIEDYKGEEETVTDDDGNPIDIDDGAWKIAQKTQPTLVQQMDQPFNVETKEGPAHGEAKDYLAQGVEGEEWPIDQEIFDKTHKIKGPAKGETREDTFGQDVGKHGPSVPSFAIAQAAQRESRHESVATSWQRNSGLAKEANDGKALSHAGNVQGMGVPSSTPDGHEDLEQDELDKIDKNWKDILKFSDHAFKSKPLPLAMRFIEKFLEKNGVCTKHSMQVAGVLSKFFGQEQHPTSMIVPKAIPRITQEPNVKGSGHYSGGHPGPFHPV